MDVHFLSDAPRVAGSEIWLLTLLPRLLDYGLRPTVHLTSRSGLNDLAQRFGQHGIRVRRYSRLETHLSQQPQQTLWVVQAWQPSLYQTCLTHLTGVRLAVIHDQIDFFYPGLRPLYRQAFLLGKALKLRHFDGLITVSHWAAQVMRQHGYPQVQTVCNGVDPLVYQPVGHPDQRYQLRQRWGLEGFCVVVPGRLAPEKNPLTALRVARHLPQMKFYFVGDDHSRTGQLCHRLAQRWRLNNVFFWGKMWEMPQVYQAMDAVLQPTLAENQSLVTLEAMASGIPVVTTHIPAQQELIEHQQHGFCLPPSSRLLAQALQQLAHNPQQAQLLAQQARQRVLQHHTLDHSAQQLAELLLEHGQRAGLPLRP